jgi:hypothetical protein
MAATNPAKITPQIAQVKTVRMATPSLLLPIAQLIQ